MPVSHALLKYNNPNDFFSLLLLVCEWSFSLLNVSALVLCRELVKIGCNLANHFPSLLTLIGTYERNTIDCMMLAITTAR